jgi:ribosomal protein S18 acetylase RimI-like enzyme
MASVDIQFVKPQEANLENIYLDIIAGAKNGHFNDAYVDSHDAQKNLQMLLTQAIRGGEVLMPPPVGLQPVSSYAKLFSVEVKKCVVGYVLILKKKKSIEMLFAGVYQEHRGKGYGVALCAHFKKLYKKQNLVVRCKKNSEQMVGILLKLNFKIKEVDYPTVNTYLVYE